LPARWHRGLIVTPPRRAMQRVSAGFGHIRTLSGALAVEPAVAQPLKPTPPHPSKSWPVAPWASLAPAQPTGRVAPVTPPLALDPYGPVPEEIIATQRRHIQDKAPLLTSIDAINPLTLDAAQPVVRNLQTFCEDKFPPSTVCFDMTQLPLRTQLLRLSLMLFGE
jgi:hypothetical protein